MLCKVVQWSTIFKLVGEMLLLQMDASFTFRVKMGNITWLLTVHSLIFRTFVTLKVHRNPTQSTVMEHQSLLQQLINHRFFFFQHLFFRLESKLISLHYFQYQLFNKVSLTFLTMTKSSVGPRFYLTRNLCKVKLFSSS